MAARRSTSKKQSVASSKSQPPRNTPPIFFLDRDLGRYQVADALRAIGASVEIHDDHFPPNALDSEWLPEIGRRGWILLSKDRHILSRPLEIIAFLRANIFAFVLRQGRNREMTGQQIADAFTSAYEQMLGLIRAHTPPLIARVTPAGNVCRIEGYTSLQLRAIDARRK